MLFKEYHRECVTEEFVEQTSLYRYIYDNEFHGKGILKRLQSEPKMCVRYISVVTETYQAHGRGYILIRGAWSTGLIRKLSGTASTTMTSPFIFFVSLVQVASHTKIYCLSWYLTYTGISPSVVLMMH